MPKKFLLEVIGGVCIFGGLFALSRAINESYDYAIVHKDGRVEVRETLSLSLDLAPLTLFLNPKVIYYGKKQDGSEYFHYESVEYFCYGVKYKDMWLINEDGKPGVDVIRINNEIYTRNDENKDLFEKADEQWKEFWDKLGIEQLLKNSETNKKQRDIDLEMIIVDKTNFDEKVLKSAIPVIVDFYADWCGPCQALKPIFKNLAEEYKGRIIFAKLDVDKNRELAAMYGIRGIPCMIIFNKGEEVERIVGYKSEDDLRKEIDEILEEIK